MKASLKTVSLALLIAIGMGLGMSTYSRAEEAPAAAPAAQTEAAPPPGMKLVPEDLTADLNISAYSQYIWRGYALSRDSFVMFPQLSLGYKGFAVTVWTDLDTNFYPRSAHNFRLQETDIIATYSNTFKKLNYTLGWIYYDTDGANGLTPSKNQEFFVTLGLDMLLKPYLSVYQEIELGHAWYFQAGVSHSIPVFKDMSLDLAASVSYYNNKSFGNFSDFHDGNVSVGLKIPINKYLSVKPNLQYSFPLTSAACRDIKAGSMGGDAQFVYGGLIFDLAI